MEDEQGAQTPEFDPDNISVHDLAETMESGNESANADNEAEDTEAEPGATGEEGVADDATESEPDEAAPAAEDSDDDTQLGLPELPSELAENEAFRKRWAEIEVGVKQAVGKAKTRLAEATEAQAQAKAVAEYIAPLAEFKDRLENPYTAVSAFRELADAVKQMTGVDVFAGSSGTDLETDADYATWQDAGFSRQEYMDARAKGFAFPGEYRAYALALEEHKKDPLYQELLNQREEGKKAAEFGAKVERLAPHVIGFFGKTDGFPVTKKMVEEAIRTFPNSQDDVQEAIRAVKMRYVDEYAKHTAERTTKTYGKKKAPEMPESATAKGMSLKDLDPETATIEELMQA